jgi:hypothetical protein
MRHITVFPYEKLPALPEENSTYYSTVVLYILNVYCVQLNTNQRLSYFSAQIYLNTIHIRTGTSDFFFNGTLSFLFYCLTIAAVRMYKLCFYLYLFGLVYRFIRRNQCKKYAK